MVNFVSFHQMLRYDVTDEMLQHCLINLTADVCERGGGIWHGFKGPATLTSPTDIVKTFTNVANSIIIVPSIAT